MFSKGGGLTTKKKYHSHNASPNAHAMLSPLSDRWNLRRRVVVMASAPAHLPWSPCNSAPAPYRSPPRPGRSPLGLARVVHDLHRPRVLREHPFSADAW